MFGPRNYLAVFSMAENSEIDCLINILILDVLIIIQKWVKSFAIFWYVQICGAYITWLKQFKKYLPWLSIASISVWLENYTDEHVNSVTYVIETTKKNICYAKGERAVDHSTVTRWFKRFLQVAKFLTIRQRLKVWIPRPSSKS